MIPRYPNTYFEGLPRELLEETYRYSQCIAEIITVVPKEHYEIHVFIFGSNMEIILDISRDFVLHNTSISRFVKKKKPFIVLGYDISLGRTNNGMLIVTDRYCNVLIGDIPECPQLTRALLQVERLMFEKS